MIHDDVADYMRELLGQLAIARGQLQQQGETYDVNNEHKGGYILGQLDAVQKFEKKIYEDLQAKLKETQKHTRGFRR